jgi:DNA-binding response OmpR family regulator
VCTPQRILIVDDEDAILFAMRDYFTVRGYEVDAARDVAEAVACLDTSTYTAVIADLCLSGMPGAEGLDVAEHARRAASGTPVILFTAYGSPEIESEARRRGVLAVLKKPQPLVEVERLITVRLPECGDRQGGAAS